MIFNKLDDSAVGKIRPRFKLSSPEKLSTVVDLIYQTAKKDESIILLKQLDSHIKITIPLKEKHYWSPVLNLSFDNTEEENKTIIRGQIGPSENIWGLFILFYSAIAILGFFGTAWAYVQWMMHQNAAYFIVAPIAIGLLFSIFLSSKYGQRKAHLQTLHIMRFLRKAVDTIECQRIS